MRSASTGHRRWPRADTPGRSGWGLSAVVLAAGHEQVALNGRAWWKHCGVNLQGDVRLCCLISCEAEEAMQKLEKEKQQQDYLIDDLQVRGRVWTGPAAVACV